MCLLSTICFIANFVFSFVVFFNTFSPVDVAQAATTVPYVISGTYVGDGFDNKVITGLGFQPDAVFITPNNGSSPHTVVSTSVMPSGITAILKHDAGNASSNLIKSLDSDGFTLGTSVMVNSSGVAYYWTAFKSIAGSMKVGSYAGDGINNHEISGVGFQPDYVLILTQLSGQWSNGGSSAMESGVTRGFGDNGNPGRINSFTNDGFKLGTSGSANNNGSDYYYIAWKAIPGRIAVGSYTGNSIDDRNISVGLLPEFVMIQSNTSANPVLRTSPMSGDLSLQMDAGGNPTSNLIQALIDETETASDGFQVGTSGSVNTSGATYYYLAFLRSAPPTFIQTAYRFFNNNDDTDVGSDLAGINTPVNLISLGQSFRLRTLVKIGNDQLVQNGETFKLQYAGKGAGTCTNPAGVPGTYTDVTTSTVIAYKDNPAPVDGATLTANSSDPTNAADVVIPQSYEEANDFTNSVAAIPSGQDGQWDFSLFDNGAPLNTTYCFRIVTSDGLAPVTYSVYPEITSVNDVTPPTVLNVTSSTADGVYSIGGTVSIQLSMSENVLVTGIPQLTLETGSTDAVASYVSGSGTDTLTFSYTVTDGQNSTDLDYVSTSALTLNGGTIQDTAGNDATLTLVSPGTPGSLGSSKNIVIDTSAPVVQDVTSSALDAVYNLGNTLFLQIVFSEIVNVNGTPQLTLETGLSDAIVNYVSGSGTNTLTFSYTVAPGQNSSDLEYFGVHALSLNGGTINDIANNNAVLLLPNPTELHSLSFNKNIIVQTSVSVGGTDGVSSGGGGGVSNGEVGNGDVNSNVQDTNGSSDTQGTGDSSNVLPQQTPATMTFDQMVSHNSEGFAPERLDIFSDGKVDILDFNLLMVHWGEDFGDKNDQFCHDKAIADINCDGKVELLDFNLLMIYWDESVSKK